MDSSNLHHNILFLDEIGFDPSNGLYIADSFGQAPVLENVDHPNEVAESTNFGVEVDDTLIAARQLNATHNHNHNLYAQSFQTLPMNTPQTSVPRTPYVSIHEGYRFSEMMPPVGTQYYDEVASRVQPPELSYAMSGTSLSKDASTYGPYFFDEPTEMGHMYQVAQGMQRQMFDENRPRVSSVAVSSLQRPAFEANRIHGQMDLMSTQNPSCYSFNETHLCSAAVSVGGYNTVGRHVQNPLSFEMPKQSNIALDSTESYPSSLVDVAIHSTHDGLWHPASDDVMPPKFVRMERGNKQLPLESSSVAETFDMSPRRHHRLVPPNRDAHAASSSKTLERSTEDCEGNAPDNGPRTQSTDCEDIPTIECDSVGVVASQKESSRLKPATATKEKNRSTALEMQKKPSKKARVPCPKKGCNTTFASNSERNRHVRTSRDHVSQGTFNCEICGDFFSRNDSLRRHVSTQHKDGDEPRRGDDVEYDVESEDEYSEDGKRFEDEE